MVRIILPILALLLSPLACDGGEEASAPSPAPNQVPAALTAPADGAVAADADVEEAPEEAPEEAEAQEPTGPSLGLEVDAWPFAVDATQLDAATVTGEDILFVASQRTPKRPLIEPAALRITTHRVGDEDGAVAWEAAALGPSAVALSASGDRVLAAWSQRAHPGRELALLVLGRGVDAPRHRTIAPDDGAAFEPVDRPIIAPAREGGWLVCTRDGRWAPRCAKVDRRGQVKSWRAIRGMKSYPPWRLLPAGDGYNLFGANCAVERCRSPRVVLQALNGTGTPRGSLRFITRMEARRGLGVIPVGEGALLFGRRRGARHGMAMLIKRKGVRELKGRYTRTIGAVATDEGALLAEVDTLHMVDGRPERSFQPRRWQRKAARPGRDGRARDGRLDTAAWPGAIADRLPDTLDQRVLSEEGLLVSWDLPRKGKLRGVALRPGDPLPEETGDAKADR